MAVEVDDLLKEIGELDSEPGQSDEVPEPSNPRGVEVQWLGDVTDDSDSSSEPGKRSVTSRPEDAHHNQLYSQTFAVEPGTDRSSRAEPAEPAEPAAEVAELQECIAKMTAEVSSMKQRLSQVEEERDALMLQLTELEEESQRRSRQLTSELKEARGREESLQEQAEEFQQSLEEALAEAKAAKAHVQELQDMLATAAADAAAARPRVAKEDGSNTGAAELKVLKEKLEESRSCKLSLDPGVLSSWLLGYLGFAEESAERDRLKVAELSRALAEAPVKDAEISPPVERPEPKRKRLGSLLDLRAQHRQRLLDQLRCAARRRAAGASSAEFAVQRLLGRLRRQLEEVKVQPLEPAAAPAPAAPAAASRMEPSSSPPRIRGGQRIASRSSSPPPVVMMPEASTRPPSAEKPKPMALTSASRRPGDKQFAADALRHAVFSLSLQSIA